MDFVERETRIYDAAATGGLRAFSGETNPQIVHVVAINHPRGWVGWMHGINCHEYGFHVGYGQNNRWYDSVGDTLGKGIEALLATAPFVGPVEWSFLFTLHTQRWRILTRIWDAAEDGRLRVFSRRNRDFVAIVSGASDMWRYKSYCRRFGEIVAVRSNHRPWTTIGGGNLLGMERLFAKASKADLP